MEALQPLQLHHLFAFTSRLYPFSPPPTFQSYLCCTPTMPLLPARRTSCQWLQGHILGLRIGGATQHWVCPLAALKDRNGAGLGQSCAELALVGAGGYFPRDSSVLGATV